MYKKMKGCKTMSNIRKRIIALTAVACVAVSSVASCSGSNSGNSGKGGQSSASAGNNMDDNLDHIVNEDGNIVGTPFQTGSPEDLANSGLTPPDPDVDLNSADPVSKEPATEIVEVTEANGEKATDANGKVVTQIVTKPTQASDASGYKSKMESRYCLWVDISKDSDYIFNDKFIKITFKLKDNIPDKDYPVRFTPDFSSVTGVSTPPDKVIQGNIRVGGSIEAQNVSSETGFVAYGDNVSAKAGDTVDYYINLKNNPGLAAILVWVYYDANAMEVVKLMPAGEFAEASNGSADIGKKPN